MPAARGCGPVRCPPAPAGVIAGPWRVSLPLPAAIRTAFLMVIASIAASVLLRPGGSTILTFHQLTASCVVLSCCRAAARALLSGFNSTSGITVFDGSLSIDGLGTKINQLFLG
jgi:hypothetical protein